MSPCDGVDRFAVVALGSAMATSVAAAVFCSVALTSTALVATVCVFVSLPATLGLALSLATEAGAMGANADNKKCIRGKGTMLTAVLRRSVLSSPGKRRLAVNSAMEAATNELRSVNEGDA